MKLYKYVGFKRSEDIFIRNLLRFTQPKFLNDTFELSPQVTSIIDPNKSKDFIKLLGNHFEENINEFENEFKKSVIENLKKYNPNIELDPTSIPNNLFYFFAKQAFPEFSKHFINEISSTNYADNVLDKIKNTFNTEYGILSLSEIPNDRLMWSHYADSHKGIVIEFDSNHSFFNPLINERSRIGKLKKVKYINNPIPFSLLDPTDLSEEYADFLIENFIYTKSKDWEYEKEWRIIRPLKEADIINGDLYFFVFSIQCLTGIILGCKTSQDDILKIKETLSKDSKYSHIKLMQSFQSKSGFEIEIHDF